LLLVLLAGCRDDDGPTDGPEEPTTEVRKLYEQGAVFITAITDDAETYALIDRIKGSAIVLHDEYVLTGDGVNEDYVATFRQTGHVSHAIHVHDSYVSTVEYPPAYYEDEDGNVTILGPSTETETTTSHYDHEIIVFCNDSEMEIEIAEITPENEAVEVAWYSQKVAEFSQKHGGKVLKDASVSSDFVDPGSQYTYFAQTYTVNIDGQNYSYKMDECYQYTDVYLFPPADRDYIMYGASITLHGNDLGWRRYDSGNHSGETVAGFSRRIDNYAQLVPWNGGKYKWTDAAQTRIHLQEYAPETVSGSTTYATGVSFSLSGNFGFNSAGPSAGTTAGISWTDTQSSAVPDVAAYVQLPDDVTRYYTRYEIAPPDVHATKSGFGDIDIDDPKSSAVNTVTHKFSMVWAIDNPKSPDTMTNPATWNTGAGAPYRIDTYTQSCIAKISGDYSNSLHTSYSWGETWYWSSTGTRILDIYVPNRTTQPS
jgi:hypothetical protein